ncbi:hypothetical protein B0O80DRAFT_272590 [Mortierella sp. GBAus27b]|nr:hypothetical protein B0O80DRAFT_272590 [Mortierella sp. GBAus27b]
MQQYGVERAGNKHKHKHMEWHAGSFIALHDPHVVDLLSYKAHFFFRLAALPCVLGNCPGKERENPHGHYTDHPQTFILFFAGISVSLAVIPVSVTIIPASIAIIRSTTTMVVTIVWISTARLLISRILVLRHVPNVPCLRDGQRLDLGPLSTPFLGQRTSNCTDGPLTHIRIRVDMWIIWRGW